MQTQRTTWYVSPSYTWAGGGYFGATPPDSLESFGRLVTRIGAALHAQGAAEGVLMLDEKAARITGMDDPMDGHRHRALDSAAAAGWTPGKLGVWTAIRGTDRPTIHVGQLAQLDALAQEDGRLWPFGQLAYPADVVAAVQAWHRLTGVAWQAGAPVMGLKLMQEEIKPYRAVGRDGKAQQRRPDLRDDSTPPGATVAMWSPLMWRRAAPGRYLHGYDKRRAGIVAAGVAKLSPAKLKRHRGPFDPKRAGWWLVVVPPWNVAEMPHPLGPSAADTARMVGGGNRLWVPTATMDLAAELAELGELAMPEVVDSMTGPARPVLKPWSDRIERAYQGLADPDGEYDDIAQEAVRNALKLSGNAGLGLTGKIVRTDDDGNTSGIPSIWRQDWYASVNATKQANAWRKAYAIGKTEQRWPFAYDDDKIFYASDEADPDKAAPAGLGDLHKDQPGYYRTESTIKRRRKGE